MGIVWQIARRFLLSRRSERFLSLVAVVSIAGIGLGVAALVVVTSVVNGFEGEISRVVTGLHGDVVLYSRGDPIARPSEVVERVQRSVPEVTAITQGFVSELMISGPKGVAGMVWEGVENEQVDRVLDLKKRVIQGGFADGAQEVVLGKALAERIGVVPGDTVRLVAPLINEGSPQVARATVVGIADLGMYQYNSKFGFSKISDLQNFFEKPGQATSFKLKLKAGTDPERISGILSQSFGYPLRAKSWRELNHNLFYAIALEKVVISLLLTVLVVVAAFNVVSTLMILMHEKAQAIAILKTVGFSPTQQFYLLTLLGLGLGALGTLAGLGFGGLLNLLLANVRILDLPPEVYHISYLPVQVRWIEIGGIAVVSLLLSFAISLFPAWKASRQFPLEGLRYE